MTTEKPELKCENREAWKAALSGISRTLTETGDRPEQPADLEAAPISAGASVQVDPDPDEPDWGIVEE